MPKQQQINHPFTMIVCTAVQIIDYLYIVIGCEYN